MKKKYFNKETLAEAAQILQPVSPTDEHYQAHWYNDGLGLQIRIAQENFIRNFKRPLVDCKTKAEVNELISAFGNTPEWPPYVKQYEKDEERLQQANHEFWTNGFGGLIRKEWFAMFQKFIDFLNSLN